MKNIEKSAYAKMFMVTPTVYEKLLECIDEKQHESLKQLNCTHQVDKNTFASNYIKNISNDDINKGNNYTKRDKKNFRNNGNNNDDNDSDGDDYPNLNEDEERMFQNQNQTWNMPVPTEHETDQNYETNFDPAQSLQRYYQQQPALQPELDPNYETDFITLQTTQNQPYSQVEINQDPSYEIDVTPSQAIQNFQNLPVMSATRPPITYDISKKIILEQMIQI